MTEALKNTGKLKMGSLGCFQESQRSSKHTGDSTSDTNRLVDNEGIVPRSLHPYKRRPHSQHTLQLFWSILDLI